MTEFMQHNMHVWHLALLPSHNCSISEYCQCVICGASIRIIGFRVDHCHLHLAITAAPTTCHGVYRTNNISYLTHVFVSLHCRTLHIQ